MYSVNPFTALRTCKTCHIEYPLACFNSRDGRIGIICRNCGRLHHLRENYAWCDVCELFQERRMHFNRYNEYGHLVPSPMCQSCHREHSVPVGSDSSPTPSHADSELNDQEVY